MFRCRGWTNPPWPAPGDLVELRSFDVQEYYNQTEIVGLKADTDGNIRVIAALRAATAVPVPPLADPGADPAGMYEPFEGMRVRSASTAR